MNRSRLTVALPLGVLATALVVAVAVVPGLATDHDDPVTAPQPVFDHGEDAQSFVILADLSTSPVTVPLVTVGPLRAYSHLGDPPLLQLTLRDHTGATQSQYNSWDPRWGFDEKAGGGERRVPRSGPGDLTAPFDPDAESMLVSDLRTGQDLVEIDLAPAIREYCEANLDDPDCVEADLAVTATAATGPDFSVIGDAVQVAVDTTVRNLGPDGPADADVVQVASASAGVSVAPTQRDLTAGGLAAGGASATVQGAFDVTCTAPGAQSVTFTSTVSPSRAKVVDTNAANDSRSVTYAVDCAVPVTVNVKPGSLRNPVNLKERAIPTAVLSTAAGEYGNPLAFDALQIQIGTVRFAERAALLAAANAGPPEMHGKLHPENVLELDEVTRDGDLDAMLHVDGRLVPTRLGMAELCVRGRFGPGAGTSFFGCDLVEIVP